MTNHVVAHDGSVHPVGFECLHCGAVLGITLPASVDEFCAAADAFEKRHRGCEKPEAKRGDMRS